MSWNNGGPPPFFGPHGPPPPDSPFWDFVNSQSAGYGVDHTGGPSEHGFGFGFGPRGFGGRRGRGGPPFGPFGPFGRGRRHSHHGRGNRPADEDEVLFDITQHAAAAEVEMEQGTNNRDPEKADSPETMRDADGEEHPDPPEEAPPSYPGGRRHGCPGRGRRGGFWSRGGRRGPPFGGPPFGGPPPWAAAGGPPPWAAGGPPFGGPPFGGPPPWVTGNWDFAAPFVEALGNSPFAQRVKEYFERIRRQTDRGANAAEGNEEGVTDEEGSFTPPIDVFDTANNWTVHVALPGAKKEDIGVHWDADRKLLTVSGVVHRPGDEEFINNMVSSERRVGVFERKIQLPPVEVENEKNDEVDGDHITAKIDNGILVVVVPKAEREWTEIKKVDIL
ncbi:HSP20-like chaperone [Immersiella caudata]|uniref:HSP20-like chaperone n=1 Tax=Immersiella caudata TaxID=314043 RepID=A0AA40CCM4_9PEZI|nr:HSP20-like chaperone [Immersiella caudata]